MDLIGTRHLPRNGYKTAYQQIAAMVSVSRVRSHDIVSVTAMCRSNKDGLAERHVVSSCRLPPRPSPLGLGVVRLTLMGSPDSMITGLAWLSPRPLVKLAPLWRYCFRFHMRIDENRRFCHAGSAPLEDSLWSDMKNIQAK